MSSELQNKEYQSWIIEVKDKIQQTQIKASLSVNVALIELYWYLGSSISQKIKQNNWGSSVVDSLAKDLKQLFPYQKGFSRRNLFLMRKWYEFYVVEDKGDVIVQQLVGQIQETDGNEHIQFVQQLVAQIPWGQNIVIISKSKSLEEAFFYIQKTIENNWSRSVLTHQIELDLFERQGKAITNFETTLPKAQSDLAKETLKDPYKLDFLNLTEKVQEKDLENQLTEQITSFLLEL